MVYTTVGTIRKCCVSNARNGVGEIPGTGRESVLFAFVRKRKLRLARNKYDVNGKTRIITIIGAPSDCARDDIAEPAD